MDHDNCIETSSIFELYLNMRTFARLIAESDQLTIINDTLDQVKYAPVDLASLGELDESKERFLPISVDGWQLDSNRCGRKVTTVVPVKIYVN